MMNLAIALYRSMFSHDPREAIVSSSSSVKLLYSGKHSAFTKAVRTSFLEPPKLGKSQFIEQ
jgi:hypothetical protein